MGSCGQHTTVQVPSGQGHCEKPGPWADADTARTSGPEMCVSVCLVVAVEQCLVPARRDRVLRTLRAHIDALLRRVGVRHSDCAGAPVDAVVPRVALAASHWHAHVRGA